MLSESESESVMFACFCPFFGLSKSISWGVVVVGSCCGEVGSVVVPVEGELKAVAVCSVSGVTVGSGSIISCSWAVLSVFSSCWLLGSGGGGGGEKRVVGHNRGTCGHGHYIFGESARSRCTHCRWVSGWCGLFYTIRRRF